MTSTHRPRPALDLPPPARSFASDNAAGAHPAVLEAIAAANHGHALAYGQDALTARCEERFRELFDADVETRLAFNGTGANIVALATMLAAKPGPHRAVVCSDWSHINVDETAAPERVLASKLIDLSTTEAKIRPEQLTEQAHLQGVVHHPQPGVVSITQPTELGTLYTIDEIRELCRVAHDMGMFVHLDGARISNATAALGGSHHTLRAMTIEAGVDAISFGGTKTGALGAEAVVFLNPACAIGSDFVRKQVTQLPSKMRYLAAQFLALLDDDLWIRLGHQSNTMARALHGEVAAIDGIDPGRVPAVNALFPILPADLIEPLQQWSFFWPWDISINQVRWMTAWDTTPDDVDSFVAGVRTLATA